MRELLLAIQGKLTQCLENQNITEEICLEDIIKIMSDYYSTLEPKIITEILDGGVIMNDECCVQVISATRTFFRKNT